MIKKKLSTKSQIIDANRRVQELNTVGIMLEDIRKLVIEEEKKDQYPPAQKQHKVCDDENLRQEAEFQKVLRLSY